MTPKHLRVFIALADTLNFAAAASRVHLSQPAFSLSLKALEKQVGGRLAFRTTRHVRLTPEGESLLPRARRLLADWDDTQQMLRQRFTLQRGHVTVAAMPSFAANLLPGLLGVYRKQHPKVDVAILDVIHEEVLDLVAKGRVELGFGFEPDSSNELHFTPLFADRFVAALPPPRPLSRRAPDRLARVACTSFHRVAAALNRTHHDGGAVTRARAGTCGFNGVTSVGDGRRIGGGRIGRECRSSSVRPADAASWGTMRTTSCTQRRSQRGAHNRPARGTFRRCSRFACHCGS